MERYTLRLTPKAWNSLLIVTSRTHLPGEPLLNLAWPFDRAKVSERALAEQAANVQSPLPAPLSGKLFMVEFAADARGKGARA